LPFDSGIIRACGGSTPGGPGAGQTEAGQSLKLTPANAAVNKKAVWPYLPNIRFHVQDYTLVWLPFREATHDMIQYPTGISINKAALGFGRRL